MDVESCMTQSPHHHSQQPTNDWANDWVCDQLTLVNLLALTALVGSAWVS